MFWLMAVWIVTVGLASIIPQIFWPEAGSDTPQAANCGTVLTMLEDELLAHIGENILSARRPHQREELSRWLEAWDLRLLGAQPTCGGNETKALTELSRLRHGLRGLVDRFDREQAPRIERIHALLGSVQEYPGVDPREDAIQP